MDRPRSRSCRSPRGEEAPQAAAGQGTPAVGGRAAAPPGGLAPVLCQARFADVEQGITLREGSRLRPAPSPGGQLRGAGSQRAGRCPLRGILRRLHAQAVGHRTLPSPRLRHAADSGALQRGPQLLPPQPRGDPPGRLHGADRRHARSSQDFRVLRGDGGPSACLTVPAHDLHRPDRRLVRLRIGPPRLPHARFRGVPDNRHLPGRRAGKLLRSLGALDAHHQAQTLHALGAPCRDGLCARDQSRVQGGRYSLLPAASRRRRAAGLALLRRGPCELRRELRRAACHLSLHRHGCRRCGSACGGEGHRADAQGRRDATRLLHHANARS